MRTVELHATELEQVIFACRRQILLGIAKNPAGHACHEIEILEDAVKKLEESFSK